LIQFVSIVERDFADTDATGFPARSDLSTQSLFEPSASPKSWPPFNIQVNAIEARFLYGTTYFPGPRWANCRGDAQMKAVIEKQVPMKSFGRPEEMAEPIALLASHKATYLSGQTIKFAGAWSRRRAFRIFTLHADQESGSKQERIAGERNS
jgi:hypothetical protein